MDIVTITGTSSLMKTSQTQQALSTTMMKEAADAQNAIADLLAQNAKQAPQPKPDPNFSFSIYA